MGRKSGGEQVHLNLLRVGPGYRASRTSLVGLGLFEVRSELPEVFAQGFEEAALV